MRFFLAKYTFVQDLIEDGTLTPEEAQKHPLRNMLDQCVGCSRLLEYTGQIEPFSAGVVRHGLNHQAAQVMAEAGVDISGQYSKAIDDLPNQEFEAVITLCAHANETCPFFGQKSVSFHQGFDDPPRLAQDVLEEEDKLNIYRRVRDEIKDFVQTLPDQLG